MSTVVVLVRARPLSSVVSMRMLTRFYDKISKLAWFLSYDKDAKFSTNFTEILTSNLGPFVVVIVKILK